MGRGTQTAIGLDFFVYINVFRFWVNIRATEGLTNDRVNVLRVEKNKCFFSSGCGDCLHACGWQKWPTYAFSVDLCNDVLYETCFLFTQTSTCTTWWRRQRNINICLFPGLFSADLRVPWYSLWSNLTRFQDMEVFTFSFHFPQQLSRGNELRATVNELTSPIICLINS